MFDRILVAYDGSPESGRALTAGIQLVKSLKSDLRTVYVYERLPAVTWNVGGNGASVLLPQTSVLYYRMLQVRAQQAAREQGIALRTELLEGQARARQPCSESQSMDLRLDILGHPFEAVIEGPAVPAVQIALIFDEKVLRDRVEVTGQYPRPDVRVQPPSHDAVNRSRAPFAVSFRRVLRSGVH